MRADQLTYPTFWCCALIGKIGYTTILRDTREQVIGAVRNIQSPGIIAFTIPYQGVWSCGHKHGLPGLLPDVTLPDGWGAQLGLSAKTNSKEE